MMLDATSLLLATGAAALLVGGGFVGGGALLRPSATPGPAKGPPAESRKSTPPSSTDGARKLRETEQAISALRSELAVAKSELTVANQAREAHRVEMVELRQRSERQQQASEAETKRLGAELVTEKGRVVEAEKSLAAAKSEAKAAREELEKAQAAAKSGSDAKTITALQDEIQSLQPLKTKIAAATEERDAARAKVEALERLIEGVRARSRQLSEELKALKKE